MKRLLTLALTVLALTACAESTATVDTGDPWETKTADPAFVRRAEDALATAEPTEPDWTVGIILAEREDGISWEASVLTDNGPVLVASCASGAYEGFGLITDPGDLVSWSPDGNDNQICIDEFTVIRKAAA